MQIPIKRVPIRRDMAETLLVEVGEHEIPILVAVHGEEKVKTGQIDATVDEMTIEDPRVEYERLVRLYGDNADTRRAYVDEAYGSFRQFAADLHQFAGVSAKKAKAAA